MADGSAAGGGWDAGTISALFDAEEGLLSRQAFVDGGLYQLELERIFAQTPAASAGRLL